MWQNSSVAIGIFVYHGLVVSEIAYLSGALIKPGPPTRAPQEGVGTSLQELLGDLNVLLVAVGELDG